MADNPTPTENQEITRELRSLLEPYDVQFKEVFKQLQELRQAGEDPASAKVADLTQRLIEVEQNVREIHQGKLPSKPADEKGGLERSLLGMAAATAGGNGNPLAAKPEARAITSGTTLASSGKLSDDQASEFIDFMVESSETLRIINVIQMRAPTRTLDELLVATRKIRASGEATAPTVADGVSTNKRTLTAKGVIWAEDLSLEFLEDNIERMGVQNRLSRMLAAGFANDLTDLAWNGDEDSGDAFIQVNNGWIDIAKADSAVVDYSAASDTTVKAILKNAFKTMPAQYKGLANHAFFLPINTVLTYVDEVADRATQLGDGTLVSGIPVPRYFGIPLIAQRYLASDEGVLTPTDNLVFGVMRDITVDVEWQPRKRVYEYTMTARNDYNYSKSEALVLIDGIAAGLR